MQQKPDSRILVNNDGLPCYDSVTKPAHQSLHQQPYAPGPPTAPTTRRCCSCCTKKCSVLAVIYFIVLIGMCVATFFVTRAVDASLNSNDAFPTGCGLNHSLALSNYTWYAGSHDLHYGIHVEYSYAVMFEVKSITKFDNNVNIYNGTMYLCQQVFYTQASGPYNCSNHFMYDSSTCRLHVTVSDCYKNIQHAKTDMTIEWVAYDAVHDYVSIEMSSHFPKAGGLFQLAKLNETTPKPIKCPAADHGV